MPTVYVSTSLSHGSHKTHSLSQTTLATSKFDSTGDGSFQKGSISFGHGQEITSGVNVPLSSPTGTVHEDKKQWGGDYDDDSDGLPAGVFVVILLALMVFVFYRKSRHSQQRDCSRGGYQRVQAAPDKRDQ